MLKKSQKIICVLLTILCLLSTYCKCTTEEDLLTLTTTTAPTDTTTTAVPNDTTVSNETSTDTTTETTEDNTETIPNDVYYINESNVVIDSTQVINGNCFIIANSVTINGQVGGDLFIIANNFKLDGGQIYGNVFAVCKTIDLNGLIYDLYAVCGNLTLEYDGIVYRDLRAIGTNISLNGIVGKNANISAPIIKIIENFLVYGDLTYSSISKISTIYTTDDATSSTELSSIVTGETNFSTLTIPHFSSVVSYILAIIGALIIVALVWLIVKKLFKKFDTKLQNVSIKSIFFAILKGLAVVVVAPLLIFVLLVCIIGIPVAIIAFILYVLILIVATPILCVTVAYKVMKKIKLNHILLTLIIALIAYGLGLIPLVGIFFTLLFTLAGIGLMVPVFKKNTNKEKKLIDKPKKETKKDTSKDEK